MTSIHTPFDKLTPIHPNRRITLETGATPVATRLMDMLVPLGFGQRALVVAPPKAGKTTVLRQIATAILANYSAALLFLCLVDERPEEVTDWRTEVKGPEVKLYASSFDQRISKHGRVVEQALFDARRAVEVAWWKPAAALMKSSTKSSRALETWKFACHANWPSAGSSPLSTYPLPVHARKNACSRPKN